MATKGHQEPLMAAADPATPGGAPLLGPQRAAAFPSRAAAASLAA